MHNTKYHIQYPDINNLVTDIFIKQKDYIGDIVELGSCGASPLTIKWYGEGEGKFSPIKQSEARINLLSTVNFEWEEFADFPEKEYMVEVRKGGEVYWVGHLIVDNYQEDFIAPPYEVQITAIDYLTSLKDIDFLSASDKYIYSAARIEDILQYILSKTGLDIPLRIGLDLKEEHFLDVVNHLVGIYINGSGFIKSIHTDNQSPYSCEDVLKEILIVFGATLRQNRGRWEIFHFDNGPFSFYTFPTSEHGTVVDERYLDDNGVKILSESATLEVGGAKRIVSIVQETNYEEEVIKGGKFYDGSWVSDTQHRYFTATFNDIRREGDSLYFVNKFNNLTYPNLAAAQAACQGDSIEIRVDYDRLPFGKSRIEHFLNFHFKTLLVPEYSHPSGRGIPGFDENMYQSYLTRQLADFFDGLVWGEYFRVISRNITKDQTGNLYRQTDQENLFLYKWFVGGNATWNPLLEPMLVFDKIDQRRYLNTFTKDVEADKAVNFKNPDYGYYQMIPLYDVPWFDLYDDYKEIISPGDSGYLTINISAPWFDNIQNYHTNIPSEYQINITGVNSFINEIDFENPSVEYPEENRYSSTVSASAIIPLEEIRTKLGDSGILDLGAILHNDVPTTSWRRNGVDMPLLQHTANRIIDQYSRTSHTLRASISSEQVIFLNTVLVNPLTDKTFRIHGMELDDKEAIYNVELLEILRPIDLGSYNMIRDNVGSGQIPLSEMEGSGRSYLYDLAFALIACMGHKDYISLSDNIVEKLATVQGINGGFSQHLLNGSPGGAVEFRTNAMVFYALNYYLKHRVHRKAITDKAVIISKNLNGYIQSQYFQNPMGLGFDTNVFTTVDNITYYFGLKLHDIEKSRQLRKLIEHQLFNGATVYSGMNSKVNNKMKLTEDTLRLRAFAYLFTGDASFINGIEDYYSEEVATSLLLGICFFKAREYGKYNSIANAVTDLREATGNVLLPLSTKIILNNRIKNNFFQ